MGGLAATRGLVKIVDNTLLRSGVSTVLCTESLSIIYKILSLSATTRVVPALFSPEFDKTQPLETLLDSCRDAGRSFSFPRLWLGCGNKPTLVQVMRYFSLVKVTRCYFTVTVRQCILNKMTQTL